MSPSPQPDAAKWLNEALATRDLDRLQPNMAAGGERINDARRHIRSARSLADDDTTLAISACHDAIRKDRGLAEYGDFAAASINVDHIRWAADVANRIVDAIAAELATRRPKRNT